MYFVKHKAGYVQAVLGADLSGKHLIETGIGIVDDALGRRHDLAALHQRRRHLHHLVGHIEYDGCLVTVTRRTIHFGAGFSICVQQIQCNGSRQF